MNSLSSNTFNTVAKMAGKQLLGTDNLSATNIKFVMAKKATGLLLSVAKELYKQNQTQYNQSQAQQYTQSHAQHAGDTSSENRLVPYNKAGGASSENRMVPYNKAGGASSENRMVPYNKAGGASSENRMVPYNKAGGASSENRMVPYSKAGGASSENRMVPYNKPAVVSPENQLVSNNIASRLNKEFDKKLALDVAKTDAVSNDVDLENVAQVAIDIFKWVSGKVNKALKNHNVLKSNRTQHSGTSGAHAKPNTGPSSSRPSAGSTRPQGAQANTGPSSSRPSAESTQSQGAQANTGPSSSRPSAGSTRPQGTQANTGPSSTRPSAESTQSQGAQANTGPSSSQPSAKSRRANTSKLNEAFKAFESNPNVMHSGLKSSLAPAVAGIEEIDSRIQFYLDNNEATGSDDGGVRAYVERLNEVNIAVTDKMTEFIDLVANGIDSVSSLIEFIQKKIELEALIQTEVEMLDELQTTYSESKFATESSNESTGTNKTNNTNEADRINVSEILIDKLNSTGRKDEYAYRQLTADIAVSLAKFEGFNDMTKDERKEHINAILEEEPFASGLSKFDKRAFLISVESHFKPESE